MEGTEYMFRVAAENSEGVSKWLEASKSVVAKNPYGMFNQYFDVIR